MIKRVYAPAMSSIRSLGFPHFQCRNPGSSAVALPIAYKPGPAAGDLGYLRMSISSTGHETAEEVEASSVTKAVSFSPGSGV